LHYSNKTYKNINILSSTIYITIFSDRLKTDKFQSQYNAHIHIDDLQVRERKTYITFYIL